MNLRGLKCPLPALRVKKMLSGLKAGDIIVAECTVGRSAIACQARYIALRQNFDAEPFALYPITQHKRCAGFPARPRPNNEKHPG